MEFTKTDLQKIFGATPISSLSNKKDLKYKMKKSTATLEKTLPKIFENSGLIFSVPDKESKVSLIYVFGGISYATPEWMINQVPEDLLSEKLFVFAPYTSDYYTVKKQLVDFIANKSINLNDDVSLIGFSAGALNVQKAYSPKFKFIGLIDPSTRKEYLENRLYNDNLNIIYNYENWNDYPNVKKILPKLSEKIQEVGGYSLEVKLNQADIPKYFFNKFKKKI